MIQLADMATALRVWLLAVALTFSWLPSQTGSIAGKFTDSTGGVLPGVTVTAKSEGRTQTSVTNEKGEYSIDQLRPGRYRVEAALTGFTTASAENVVVDAARTITWNGTLQVVRRGLADPLGYFQARVTEVVGSDAVDCGKHGLSESRAPAPIADLQKSLACGLEAVRQKKAFRMWFQLQGIEGLILHGVVGTTNGTLYRFWYDSDIGDGTPRFSTEVCAQPSVSVSSDGYPEIRCLQIRTKPALSFG